MAMHLAYRYHQDVAGVFALSSFLNKNSAVYQVGVKLFTIQYTTLPFFLILRTPEGYASVMHGVYLFDH